MYGYFYEMILGLVGMGVLASLAYGVYKLAHHFNGGGAAHPLTLDQLKRGTVSLAIIILLSVFIFLASQSISGSNEGSFNLSLYVGMSAACVAVAWLLRRNALVSLSLTVSGVISTFMALVQNYNSVSKLAILLLVAALWAVAIIVTVVLNRSRMQVHPHKPWLYGFRTMGVGMVIFVFSILLTYSLNGYLNPAPEYPSVAYPEAPAGYYLPIGASNYDVPAYNQYQEKLSNYQIQSSQAQQRYDNAMKESERKAFIIVFLVALVFLVLGLTIKKVAAVSTALLVAGIVDILYVVIAIKADLLGKNLLTGITGVGVLVLIGLAYWKFGQENETPKNPETY